MGLLSIFKNKVQPPAESAEVEMAATPEQWRKTPFSAFVTGADEHTVYVRERLPTVVPSFAVDFLLGCGEFRELDRHLAEHADLHAWGSLEVEALRSWLPRMIEAGLLISGTAVRAQGAAIRDAENTPVAIGAIGFPTGGERVPLLARALASFAENVRTHGRTVNFLVSDGSTDGDQQERFRGQAGALGQQYQVPVRYLGPPEKRALAAELTRRSGCAPEVAEFALFDPLGAGFSCGANRNALLLHEAGGVLSSVDDDVICELAAAPPAAARLRLFSNGDPYERWVFGDRQSALEAVCFEPRDYLAEHERALGRDLGDLLADGVDVAALDLQHLGDDLLRRLETGHARVRTTFTGYVGDPGIPTSCFFFFHKGKNRERLTDSEESYHASFASRSVLMHAPMLAIGDNSVAPGMAIGLDQRELLPPFFPVLHAEDMIFGMTTWKTCPGAVSGHLPVAVHHDSGAGKPTLLPSDLSGERRAGVFEFAQIVRALMGGFIPADHADAPTRMAMLGRYLAEFAALPPRDFREAFHRVVLEHESHKICSLEESLRKERGAPEFWRRDMQAFLDHSRVALRHEDFDIPYELKAGRTPEENRVLMQQLIGRYGRLLQEWPAMWEAARALRSSGICFSVNAAD